MFLLMPSKVMHRRRNNLQNNTREGVPICYQSEMPRRIRKLVVTRII